MRSSCGNCGAPMGLDEIYNNFCTTCEQVRAEASQHYAAEHPDASNSDILYAGRRAMSQRAHFSQQRYLDPREYTRSVHRPTPENK